MCETPWDSTAQPQQTRINLCDYYSPPNKSTPQEWRLAERRRKIKEQAYIKAMILLKRSGRSCDHKSCKRIMKIFQEAESESETPSLPTDPHSQDEMESDADSSDAESIPGASLCYAATASHDYRFELTLMRGSEDQREVASN